MEPTSEGNVASLPVGTCVCEYVVWRCLVWPEILQQRVEGVGV